MKISRSFLVFWFSFAIWQFFGIAEPQLVQADGYGRYDRQFEYGRNPRSGLPTYCPNNLLTVECQGYVIQPPRTGFYGHAGQGNVYQQNNFGGGHDSGGYSGGGNSVVLNVDLFGWIPRIIYGWNKKEEMKIINRTETDISNPHPCGVTQPPCDSREPMPKYARHLPSTNPLQHEARSGYFLSGGTEEVRTAIKKELLAMGREITLSRRRAAAEVRIVFGQRIGDPWFKIELELIDLAIPGNERLIEAHDANSDKYDSKNVFAESAAIQSAAQRVMKQFKYL